MIVYSQNSEVELSLIVDGMELIGELIDWGMFLYNPKADTWSADNDTIEGVQYLIERRLQHDCSKMPQLRRVD